ncbi:putative protein serine/threonine kinase [Tieghemostelium lacteum]|uniref:Transcription initiation factor TFIID subunit 1 n=1 Tax=Tieghemostelium lacteum TaxID=361077 RepID=A0A151Z4G4_TIELA|nr:putative protein serine/threonine kinase [Tieghemostelium lacteum]|eukprot:KYQ88850.1 putative protein serine/threonine kinase [Tieghemostelium lacteum]
MVKDNIGGFLFGNVNQSGELENEDDFFDSQLKKDLETFSKRSKISDTLNTLGVDDSETKGDRSSITTASSFVPNNNAKDFQDIDELAEEVQTSESIQNKLQSDRLARQAEENVAKLAEQLKLQRQLQQQQQQQQLVQSQQQQDVKMYDNFDEEETQEEREERELLQFQADRKKNLYKLNTQNVAYETIKAILEQPDKYDLEDMEFKTFASAKNADGSVILKFSQFFAPRIPDKRKRRKQRPHPTAVFTEDSLDYDETVLFNQSKTLKWQTRAQKKAIEDQKKKQQQALEEKERTGVDKMQSVQPQQLKVDTSSTSSMIAAAEEEDDEYVPESFKDNADQELLESFDNLDSYNFTALQQTNWEDKIIWNVPSIDPEDYSETLDGYTRNNNNNNNKQEQLQMVQPMETNQQKKTLNALLYLDPISVEIDESYINQSLGKRKRWGMLEVQVTTKENLLDSHQSKLSNMELDKEDDDIVMKDQTIPVPQQILPITSTDSNNNNNNVNNNNNINENREKEKEKQKWSLFPIQNEELENGSWVNDIIWDETNIPKSAQASILILDLNDKDMLFDEHMERLHANDQQQQQQRPTKKLSKKRIALEASLLATRAALTSMGNMVTTNAKPAASAHQPIPEEKEEDEDEPKVDIKDDKMDPFNLSNDKYYITGKLTTVQNQQSGKTMIIHSVPGLKLSLVKSHLSNDDLLNFHRPKLKFPSSQVFRIQLYNHKQDTMEDQHKSTSSRKSLGKVETMKHKSDLSAREGRVVLMEFFDQYPFLLSNVGMGCRIRNYYKKKDQNDTPILNFEDGEDVHLEHNDMSPFMGDIQPGTAVQGVHNNLFKAPIHAHNPNQTDFLLVRSKDVKKWYIRDLFTTYTIGQNLPEIEVPGPNSKNANNILKFRLQSYIYRVFLKKSNVQKRVKISDICSAFPNQSETSIRKRLKDCADFQRGGDDSGWWTVKENFILPSEDELQKLIAPEVVCTYEAMLFGLQRLQEIGIIHFTTAGTIPTSNLEDTDPTKKRYRPLEDELNLTSWNLTSNYISAQQGKSKMQLINEDGSGRNDEFSFLKMPQKVVNQKQKEFKQALQKNQVTGTDADLRKLSLADAKSVLLELGVAEKLIDSLSRWKRINLVRRKSSEAALSSDMSNNAAMTKFARGSRYSTDHQNLQYKAQAQMIFENQIKALAGHGEDQEQNLLEDLQKDLEESLFGSKRKQRGLFDEDDEDDDQEEEDRKEYNKLMELNGTPSQPRAGDVLSPPPNLSISSSNANTTTTTTTTSSSVTEEQEDLTTGDRLFVKRVTHFRKPDGTLFKRIEIIRDPTQVKEYEKKNPSLLEKKLQGGNSEELEEQRKKKRELKDLQELYRKQNQQQLQYQQQQQQQQQQQNQQNQQAPQNTGGTVISISSSGSSLKPNPPPIQKTAETLNSSSTKIRISGNTSSTNLISSTGGSNGQNDGTHRSGHSGSSSSSSRHHRDRDGSSSHSSSSSGRHHRDRDGSSGHSSSSGRHHRDKSNSESKPGSRSTSPSHHSSSLSTSSNNYDQYTTPEQQQPVQSPATLAQSGSSLLLRIPGIKSENSSNKLTSSNASITSSGNTIQIKKEEPSPTTARKKKSAQLPQDLQPIMEVDDPSKSSQNRRNRIRKDGSGAEVGLVNIFEDIIEKLRAMPEFGAFKYKVTPQIAPNYTRIIKNPIDLTTMRDRNRQWEYKTKTQFIDAIKLMVKNCYEYNETRNPHLLPIADKMLESTQQMLSVSNIEDVEKSIEQHTLSNSSSSNLKSVSSSSTSLASPKLQNITIPASELVNTIINNPTTPSTSTTTTTSTTSSSNNTYFPITKSYEEEEIDIVNFSSNSPMINDFK